jgi:hypothetical protein
LKNSFYLLEPAYFVDENDPSELTPVSNYENSIFVKSVNEFDDFKLKCIAKGKPKPVVSWYVRYANGTVLRNYLIRVFILFQMIYLFHFIPRPRCK